MFLDLLRKTNTFAKFDLGSCDVSQLSLNFFYSVVFLIIFNLRRGKEWVPPRHDALGYDVDLTNRATVTSLFHRRCQIKAGLSLKVDVDSRFASSLLGLQTFL